MWLFMSRAVFWLDKDIVPYGILLFQLERELFFPEVFIGCKSTLVCVRVNVLNMGQKKGATGVAYMQQNRSSP